MRHFNEISSIENKPSENLVGYQRIPRTKTNCLPQLVCQQCKRTFQAFLFLKLNDTNIYFLVLFLQYLYILYVHMYIYILMYICMCVYRSKMQSSHFKMSFLIEILYFLSCLLAFLNGKYKKKELRMQLQV